MRTINIVFKSLYACAHQCGFCHVLYVPRNTSYMTTEEVRKRSTASNVSSRESAWSWRCPVASSR